MLLVLMCSLLLVQLSQTEASTLTVYVGGFEVSVNGTAVSVRNADDKVVWETVPSIPFLRIGEYLMYSTLYGTVLLLVI
jgi:hypothetical protein